MTARDVDESLRRGSLRTTDLIELKGRWLPLGRIERPNERCPHAQLPNTMPARDNHSAIGPGMMPSATVATADTTSATSVVQ